MSHIPTRRLTILALDPSVKSGGKLLRTQIEILRSAALALQVVRALDLTQDPEFNQALRPPTALAQTWAAVSGWRTDLALAPRPQFRRSILASCRDPDRLAAHRGVGRLSPLGSAGPNRYSRRLV